MFSSENKRKIIKHHTYPKLIRWECWCFSNKNRHLTVHIYVDYFFQRKKSIEPWQINKLQILKNNLRRIYTKQTTSIFNNLCSLFLLLCWDLDGIIPAPVSYPVYSSRWLRSIKDKRDQWESVFLPRLRACIGPCKANFRNVWLLFSSQKTKHHKNVGYSRMLMF